MSTVIFIILGLALLLWLLFVVNVLAPRADKIVKAVENIKVRPLTKEELEELERPTSDPTYSHLACNIYHKH